MGTQSFGVKFQATKWVIFKHNSLIIWNGQDYNVSKANRGLMHNLQKQLEFLALANPNMWRFECPGV